MGLPAQLSDELAALIADRFRAIGEPTRVRILDRLRRGEASVHELAAGFGTTQQNVSKHLGLLTRAGVVARRKQGTAVYYRIADDSVLEMCEQVCGAIQRDLGNLAKAVRGERAGEPT